MTRRLEGHTFRAVIVASLCVLVVSLVGWYNGRTAIEESIEQSLVTRRTNRSIQVADALAAREAAIGAIAADPIIRQAGADLLAAYDELVARFSLATIDTDDLAGLGLEELSSANAAGIVPEDPVGQVQQKVGLFAQIPPGAEDYARAVRSHLPEVRHLADGLGFDDLLIVDAADRRVLLTSGGRSDLGANLRNGSLRGSGLAAVIDRALAAGGGVQFSDFTRYAVVREAPVAFFATSFTTSDGRPAVLAARQSTEFLDVLVDDQRGLAPSGLALEIDTSIVGSDLQLRSTPTQYVEDSEGYLARLAESGADESILERTRRNGPVLAVPAGNDTVERVFTDRLPLTAFERDALGREVRMSVQLVPNDRVDWVVVAEIDSSEALAPLRRFAIAELALGVLLALAVGIISWLVDRWLLRPKKRLDVVSRLVAEGRFAERVNDSGQDEIGAAARSLDALLDELDSVRQKTTQTRQSTQRLRESIIPAASMPGGGGNRTCLVVEVLPVGDSGETHAAEHCREAVAALRSDAVDRGIDVEMIAPTEIVLSCAEHDLGYAADFAHAWIERLQSQHENAEGVLQCRAGLGIGELHGEVLAVSRRYPVAHGAALVAARAALVAAAPGELRAAGRAGAMLVGRPLDDDEATAVVAKELA